MCCSWCSPSLPLPETQYSGPVDGGVEAPLFHIQLRKETYCITFVRLHSAISDKNAYKNWMNFGTCRVLSLSTQLQELDELWYL